MLSPYKNTVYLKEEQTIYLVTESKSKACHVNKTNIKDAVSKRLLFMRILRDKLLSHRDKSSDTLHLGRSATEATRLRFDQGKKSRLLVETSVRNGALE
jgi:hypothetical protein